ncbi:MULTISPECIES: CAP domain-containing protein [unclassified Lentimicrobium]|uniref:CAP domain-containing protein n=1 Tax=unclassified Lentimicrobium TaxID=2677434 RepID=UPI001557DBA6|nr:MULTISPECIES: CAP domain-containing protein [unclassified Lentimicrobium]NPD45510.1 CAP domain-containing protein [Lentimicrobium sp. S6]NPD84020.1 CAP domain-containing protein [Lentimicrobium sp. L6]
MKSIQIILTILFSSSIIFSQNCPTGEERIESVNSSFEKEVLRLTNKERKKRSLSPVKYDEKLALAARYHAKDMAMENYFEHDSYDREKNRLRKSCDIFERIGAFANYNYLAENISAGQLTPEEVLKAWMKSPGHKKNILNKDMTLLGVGFYENEDSEYGVYWVQNFGGN